MPREIIIKLPKVIKNDRGLSSSSREVSVRRDYLLKHVRRNSLIRERGIDVRKVEDDETKVSFFVDDDSIKEEMLRGVMSGFRWEYNMEVIILEEKKKQKSISPDNSREQLRPASSQLAEYQSIGDLSYIRDRLALTKKYEDDILNLQEENERLASKGANLESKISNVERFAEEQKKVNKGQRDEYETRIQELKDRKSEIENELKEEKKYRDEVSKLKKELEKKKNEINEIKKFIPKNQIYENSVSEVAKAETSITKENQQRVVEDSVDFISVEQIGNIFAKKERELRAREDELNKKESDYQGRIGALRRQVEEIENQYNDLERKLRDKKSAELVEISGLRENISVERKERKEQEEKAKKFEVENSKLQGHKSLLISLIKSQRKSSTLSRKELEKIKLEYEIALEEKSKLENDLAVYKPLLEEDSNLSSKVREVNSRLEEKEKQISEYKKRIGELEAEVELYKGLKEENDGLSKENAEFRTRKNEKGERQDDLGERSEKTEQIEESAQKPEPVSSPQSLEELTEIDSRTSNIQQENSIEFLRAIKRYDAVKEQVDFLEANEIEYTLGSGEIQKCKDMGIEPSKFRTLDELVASLQEKGESAKRITLSVTAAINRKYKTALDKVNDVREETKENIPIYLFDRGAISKGDREKAGIKQISILVPSDNETQNHKMTLKLTSYIQESFQGAGYHTTLQKRQGATIINLEGPADAEIKEIIGRLEKEYEKTSLAKLGFHLTTYYKEIEN